MGLCFVLLPASLPSASHRPLGLSHMKRILAVSFFWTCHLPCKSEFVEFPFPASCKALCSWESLLLPHGGAAEPGCLRCGPSDCKVQKFHLFSIISHCASLMFFFLILLWHFPLGLWGLFQQHSPFNIYSELVLLQYST